RLTFIVVVLSAWCIASMPVNGHGTGQSGTADGSCSYPPKHFDWNVYEKVDAEMTPPRPGRRSSTEPPRLSPEKNPSGTVIVRVAIGNTGAIEGTEVVRSLTCDLDKEALAFLEDYLFYPAE